MVEGITEHHKCLVAFAFPAVSDRRRQQCGSTKDDECPANALEDALDEEDPASAVATTARSTLRGPVAAALRSPSVTGVLLIWMAAAATAAAELCVEAVVAAVGDKSTAVVHHG